MRSWFAIPERVSAVVFMQTLLKNVNPRGAKGKKENHPACAGPTTNFFAPVLPHKCGGPSAGYGTPHSCGSEEFCRATARRRSRTAGLPPRRGFPSFACRMNKAIRFRLFLMMILEFVIWGAWYPLIFGYLPSLGFSTAEQS